MELRELHLQRLPGLPEPLAITGAPGLNLILGPNGSGKTSLTRAALGLLWPDEASDGHVSAVWRHDGSVWHARRAGSLAVAWQRDGQPQTSPPLVPHADQAAGFRLGLLDLLKLSADAGDASLARAIRNQMAGGYDLGQLLGQATITGREGQTAAGELARHEERVAGLRRQRRDLQQAEARLDGLRQQLQATQAATVRARVLRAAEMAATAQEAAAAARAQFAADYPAPMNRIQEQDTETLDRLRTRERTTAEELAVVARQIEDTEANLVAAGLPDGGPASTLLDTARNRLDEARRTVADLARAETALSEAAAGLQTARRNLAPWNELPVDEAVAPEALRAEADEIRILLEARAQHAAVVHLLDLAPLQPAHEAPPASPEVLATARRALLAWLAAAAERRVPWLPVTAAIALIALGIALRPWTGDAVGGTGGTGWAGWAGWAALAAGALVLVGGCWPFLLRTRSRSARETFAGTDLTGPPAWSSTAVRQRLIELADEETAARFDRLRARLREDLAAARDHAERAAGDVPFAERLNAAELLHRNAAYHAALVARDSAAAGRDALAVQLQEQLAAVGQMLAPWLGETPADHAAMVAAVDDLQQRRVHHHDAVTRRAEFVNRRAELHRTADETAAEIAALFDRLELPRQPQSDATIRACVIRLPRYQAARDEVTHLANRARLLTEGLDQLPSPADRSAAHEALAWTAEARAAALAKAEAEAGQEKELNDSIVAIRTRLETAGGDAALDEALLDRDRARDRLTAIRDQVRGKTLRRLLLTRLQRQHRERSEPPVLQRARDLFRAFTHGAYELLVADRDSESFRARDALTGEGLALNQLSDGTRAQLLLAARLAYLQEAERGLAVPLFLDESLTASDPERFAAIGRAILALIARDGRQVFYLTCDPADVAAWQQLLAEVGQPPAPVTDLARLRNLAVAAPVSRLRVDPRPAAPAPRPGEDPADYAARLGGVPRLDPHARPAGAHVFHLLRDDLPLLHRLLAQGVERAGQVQQLTPTLLAAGTLTTDQLAALEARLRALTFFCESWTVGRGRPVPPGLLSAQSGSTSSKLPEIEALLASPAIQGDAVRLVAALEAGEVSHLRGTVQAQIVDWLIQEGYLDPRPALTGDEVCVRVLRSATEDIAQQRLSLDELRGLVRAWELAVGRGD